MRALPTLLGTSLLTLATPATAQPNLYGWTISNSITDPYSNSGPIAPGASMFTGNLYLWFTCNTGDGATAAEFDVVETRGAGLPTGFQAIGPIFPQYVPPNLLIAFQSCAQAPVLAGVFIVGPDALTPDIELCIVPTPDGVNHTVDCQPLPQAWPNTSIGFAKTGNGSCIDVLCQPPVSTEGSSWGAVKGLYR
jgi:hypothetical protein